MVRRSLSAKTWAAPFQWTRVLLRFSQAKAVETLMMEVMLSRWAALANILVHQTTTSATTLPKWTSISPFLVEARTHLRVMQESRADLISGRSTRRRSTKTLPKTMPLKSCAQKIAVDRQSELTCLLRARWANNSSPYKNKVVTTSINELANV